MVERISDQISNQYIKGVGGMRLKVSGKKKIKVSGAVGKTSEIR